MGLAISQNHFDPADYQAFMEKTRRCLTVLRQLLAQPGFGDGPASLGAEVEFYLVNPEGLVQPINTELGERVPDPLLTMELNRFNLEYNLSPQPFAGTPFTAFEAELQAATAAINRAARPLAGELVTIGILPTLERSDFGPQSMTDLPRYHVMAEALRNLRGDPFHIHIGGPEPLDLYMDDVTLEGANTSYQLHWRVPVAEFANYYNAVQLATPIVLALSANSPGLFQHRLWDETRIALFKQSIDSRTHIDKAWHLPPRVYFGNGWLRHAGDAFASSVALYQPIIPQTSEEEPEAVLAAGCVPELAELKLHHGTTWPWNRVVYDHHDGGHLRIEMRALPSGPTPMDMNAGGLFLVGAALSLVESMAEITAFMPFAYAEHNFYRAAKFGLQAELIWPDPSGCQLREYPLLEIAERLLPQARQALSATAMAEAEVARLLGLIEGRIANRITGARWQTAVVERLSRQASGPEAHRQMLAHYIANSQSGKPLHEWTLPL